MAKDKCVKNYLIVETVLLLVVACVPPLMNNSIVNADSFRLAKARCDVILSVTLGVQMILKYGFSLLMIPRKLKALGVPGNPHNTLFSIGSVILLTGLISSLISTSVYALYLVSGG